MKKYVEKIQKYVGNIQENMQEICEIYEGKFEEIGLKI